MPQCNGLTNFPEWTKALNYIHCWLLVQEKWNEAAGNKYSIIYNLII